MDLGRFSPNSRFLAYRSNEPQRNKIYVRPFDPSSGAAPAEPKWQVSRDGAQGSIFISWRADGKELYYSTFDPQTTDTLVMAVDVSTTPTFQSETPKLLFRLPGPLQGNSIESNSPDGQRFVFLRLATAATPAR